MIAAHCACCNIRQHCGATSNNTAKAELSTPCHSRERCLRIAATHTDRVAAACVAARTGGGQAGGGCERRTAAAKLQSFSLRALGFARRPAGKVSLASRLRLSRKALWTRHARRCLGGFPGGSHRHSGAPCGAVQLAAALHCIACEHLRFVRRMVHAAQAKGEFMPHCCAVHRGVLQLLACAACTTGCRAIRFTCSVHCMAIGCMT